MDGVRARDAPSRLADPVPLCPGDADDTELRVTLKRKGIGGRTEYSKLGSDRGAFLTTPSLLTPAEPSPARGVAPSVRVLLVFGSGTPLKPNGSDPAGIVLLTTPLDGMTRMKADLLA